MSSSFFEAQNLFKPPTSSIIELRLYYDDEGYVLDKKYVDNALQEESNYIVITQDQYDSINFKRHRVVDKNLVWTDIKKKHWFLQQEELARNPYVKD